ncbi:MAG: hypothetical protein IT186_17880 [Acidobacteria bacterium]|nr:hypothetical protein [Acidobacteriota bacterium]
MWSTLEHQIGEAFRRLFDTFLSVIPAVLVLLAALLTGVMVGMLLKALLMGLFSLRKKRTPGTPATAGLLRAAGLTSHPERLAGSVSFWTAVVVALSVGVNALEPGALRTILLEVVSFLPKILTSAFLFVLGLGLAVLARRSVLLAAVNAGLPWARPGSRGIHAVIVISFAAAALDHLGVGRSILIAAFCIAGGGLVLALALAFGLGARDLAKAYLEKRLRAEEEETGIRHV